MTLCVVLFGLLGLGSGVVGTALFVHFYCGGYLRKADGCLPAWSVDTAAETAFDALADSMLTDKQRAVALRAVRALRITTLDHAFVPGRFDSAGAAGISIAANFRRAWVEAGGGWERRVARVVVHVAKASLLGDPDAQATDPTWFAAASAPWTRRGRDLEDDADFA